MLESFFIINADYKQANDVCQNISKTLFDMNIEAEDIASCEIAIREALNNVIKHAYQNRPNNKINLLISLKSKHITISISDFGKSRKSIKEATLDFNPKDIENLPEGGFGLYIIEKIMDTTEYKIENDKNTYIMTKLLKDKKH